MQIGDYSRVYIRGRNWRKERFAEESRGCGITLLESWRSNNWNQSVLSGIAISVEDHIVDESNEGVVKINEVEVELVEYNSSRVLKAEEVEILQFGKNYNQIDESGRNEDIGEKNKDLLEDEDDWEEIERTDLERSFGTVVVFVGSRINDNSLSNEVKMKLHGYYRIVTQSPCHEPHTIFLFFEIIYLLQHSKFERRFCHLNGRGFIETNYQN
ncbi:FERM/acyl-CoA-binding protein [Vigna unguiculata]|uniref:FERM/acyl-CoA-binding protein n=1 Tax=Vigna unguiculata TaxID=3917 RepID=A0A4D6N350_VIGUN|nr:FERM/acyl-CoA-binding protein [Vigna unguiculata]